MTDGTLVDEPVDAYSASSRETTEGRVYTVTGGDWDSIDLGGDEERIVVNMGPQHPSTHGVLRLVLELEGETVTQARTVIGYLHTGIEKTIEYRNWTQAVTLVTRMDYLSPIFNETAYCLGVEKLLGCEVPERATTIRVLTMELNRISSHLVWLATGGMELGALTAMTNGFRERELVMDILELITGLAWDLRKVEPYCGYETYEFDVPTETTADAWGRYRVRMAEMWESLKIIEQALDRLKPGPVMVQDRKIGWPAQLALGPDGLGNSLDHVKKIMGTSMEALIHHFKLVTEGFRVPVGQVYSAIENPRGELGVHIVSDGGTRPYRVHVRDPGFVNLQSASAMCEGALLADAIAAVASIDPVMGGVDR